jgi:hypothetical protein
MDSDKVCCAFSTKKPEAGRTCTLILNNEQMAFISSSNYITTV